MKIEIFKAIITSFEKKDKNGFGPGPTNWS